MSGEESLGSRSAGDGPFVPALLEAGLALLLFAAPLPFGATGPRGRLAVELFALALTAVWSVHALRRETPLPPRWATAGVLGLLAVAFAQLVPWNGAAASASPDATASALRTGAALAGTFLVATSVVAWRGGRVLGIALLFSAGFQGLYGLIVLASGHPYIWGVPKKAYIDSATGTFVNRNNFAAYLSAALPIGVGLIVAATRAIRRGSGERNGVILALGNDGSRAILLGLVAATGLAGLLLSMSRAGTTVGLAAITATLLVALRRRPWRGIALAAALVAIGAVPLLDIGADRLAGRFAASGDELTTRGGRLDVWRDTIGMAEKHPVLGSGFGSFTWAFAAYRSPAVRLHYTFAHQDLLQLAAEGGVTSVLLLGLILVPLARAIAGAIGTRTDPATIGAAFGLAALLLHALVDFPFHIPAVALLGSALAGWMFGASWNRAR